MRRIVYCICGLLFAVCSLSAADYDPLLGSKIDAYLAGGCNGACVPDSPMKGNGSIFFSAGLLGNVDPRLIVAISGDESSFGTNWQACPATGFNAWSWFWNQKDPRCVKSPFASFAVGIQTVSHFIGIWIRKGYNTIPLIEAHPYCSSGCANWIANVTGFYTYLGGDTSDLTFSLPPDAGSIYAISTVAGNGYPGYSGDGGPATSASMYDPFGVTVDASGNLYVSDENNVRVRKVATTGVITTVAGKGFPRISSGDGGLAVNAGLDFPDGLATDVSGNLYIADGPFFIRKVSDGGIISTVAGAPYFYFSLGDGGPATSADLSAEGITVDSKGNFYITDICDSRIRKVFSSNGIITTIAGTGTGGYPCTGGYSGDGGLAVNAQLNSPVSTAVDSIGNVYVADSGNCRIRMINLAGIITTVAGNGTCGYSGDGGQASDAQLNSPTGVAVDNVGNLYIADWGNQRVRKVSSGGIITTIAGNGTLGYSGDGGLAATAELAGPWGIAIGVLGRIYVSDQGNNVVRLLTPVDP